MSDEAEPTDPALPDRALQSALELAVGVAALGARMRPALSYPSGLKPYLRFHKLPPTALAKVREAVEGNAEFLHRLALVASEELVDEVGLLWLTRPPGWQQEATKLVEKVSVPLDDAGAVRKEERRREAAEAATARARLDLVVVREQLDAELSVREAAQAEVRRLEAKLTAARTEVTELKRAAARRVSLAAEGDSVADALPAELDKARALLAAAVEARDAALADRAAVHAGGPADIERVRALLVEALAATRPAEPRVRRRVRKPLPVPGGIYGHSEAAAEHLMRTVDVVVLVDGYNVAKLGWPGLKLDQQRSACIDVAEGLARRWGTLIHIVFDGASVVGASAGHRLLVKVSFSPDGVSADDVLRAEVGALDITRPVVVVTDDQEILTDVRAVGANTVSSATFLAVARR